MSEYLPLLIFPKAKILPPKKEKRRLFGEIHFPDTGRQIKRLASQAEKITARLSEIVAGLEPETVLSDSFTHQKNRFFQSLSRIKEELDRESNILPFLKENRLLVCGKST